MVSCVMAIFDEALGSDRVPGSVQLVEDPRNMDPVASVVWTDPFSALWFSRVELRARISGAVGTV